MANLSEGSSQVTSEDEESPVPHGEVQKKPAGHCLKHLKAIAVESDSGESQVTSESASESLGAFPNPGNSRAPKRKGSSSDTSETKRIKEAGQAWQHRPKKSERKQIKPGKLQSKPSASKKAESSTQETSESSSTAEANQQTDIPKPASSGMLDYCSWMVDQLSSDERESAAANWWQTFGEFCGGMGTGIICFEGLSRAMAAHDLRVNASCECLTEQSPWKAKALRELLGSLSEQTPPCDIFTHTGDLNCLVLRDFQDEVVLNKPTFDLLLMGIDCINISNLTTTPKSVMDLEGESARSLREMTQYLESLSFEDRPEGIVLECVLRLAQKRTKGLPQPEVGTELVTAALRTQGYVGAWETEDALNKYLPQSRKRTWGIYLKVKMSKHNTNPLDAERKRLEDISSAFSIVKRLRVPKHEPLQTVVGRLGIAPEAAKTKAKTSRPPNMNLDWTTRAAPQKCMKRLGITPADLLASEDLKAFWNAAGPTIMNQSCRRNVLMRLASLRKKGKVPDWRETVLAFNADESAYRLGLGITHFPCVQPKRILIMALNGKLVKADGKVCLAMQGIQSKELQAFPTLSKQSSNRQQDWAGNAFTANTCAAYMLAVAVVR